MDSDHMKGLRGLVMYSVALMVATIVLPALSIAYSGDEGDWLIWRIGDEPASLNCITSRNISSYWIVNGNIFESLLEYDLDGGKLRPLLAESYKISADGLKITFRLRENVCFSDGVAITSSDVVFTYQTIMNPQIDSGNLASRYRLVKEVAAVDERRVKFVLRQGHFKGAEICGLMQILPKHVYEFSDPAEFNRHRSNPVGSGPYVFDKWRVGREIVLRRNERYWREKPWLGRIVFRVITNDLAALQALRSHDIDFMAGSCEQFVELSGDRDFASEFQSLSYWNPGVGYSYIAWNQNTPFFSDGRVRLAMTHLVDRELLVEQFLGGLGKVVTGPFYVFSDQYDSSIEPWPYDLEHAKELLDRAGWVDNDGDGIRDKNGVAFRFRFMIFSGYVRGQQVARLLKDQMAKAGIDMIIEPYEGSIFIDRLHSGAFDAAMLAHSGELEEDPHEMWHSSQANGRGRNVVGFENVEADAIIAEARKTLDSKKRNELYHRLHSIIHKEQPYTFLWSRPSVRFLDRRFENVKIHKLGVNLRQWHVSKAMQRYK